MFLSVAYKTGKRDLVILACEIVAKNFTLLYKIDKLLLNNSEVLSMIFSDENSDVNFDAMMEFFAKWVKINRNREKYLEMLLKEIVPEEFPISIYCLKNLLLSKFQPERVCKEEDHTSSSNPIIVDDYSFRLNLNCDLNLCVYHNCDEVWNIYELYSTKNDAEVKWKLVNEDIATFTECKKIYGTITDCRRQFVYSSRELYTLLCHNKGSSYDISAILKFSTSNS